MTEFDDFLEEAKQKTSTFIEDLILDLIKQLHYGCAVNQDQTCKINDPLPTLEDSHDMQHKAEIFESPLVQSIREKYANIEKISDFECEDMENQNSEDVL